MTDLFEVPLPTPGRRRAELAALAGSMAVTGFVLVACSGGGAKSASTSAPSTPAQSTPAQSTPAQSTADTSSANASTTDPSSATHRSAASSATAIPHGSSSSSFCALARSAQRAQDKEAGVLTSGSATALKRVEKQDLAVLNLAVSAAPASIRPAMVTIAAADRVLYKELATVQFDIRRLSVAQTRSLRAPALAHATDQVTSYLTNVCHIRTP